jgi:two-component system sensor histidine kinase KdpD
VLLAVANMLAFDFYYVPPRFSFDVDDEQYFFTMGVMLFVALVIANLMINISRHRELADARERRTAVLYAMSRELVAASDAPAMAAAAVRHLCDVFHCGAVVLIADQNGNLAPLAGADESGDVPDPPSKMVDLEAARAAVARGERGGARAIYQPLRTGSRAQGAIVLVRRPDAPSLLKEQFELLDAFSVQVASALQRIQLVAAAEAARSSEEQALLRNTLLASISHDLRTPLSAIAGAGSLIAQPGGALDLDRRITLGHLIEQKACDMSQQLSNILELMQMEHGGAIVRTDWHSIDDLIGHSLKVNESRLAGRSIHLDLPEDLPLILVEPALVVQILNNLLENAAKYTPSGTRVTISAAARERGISLSVADNGPGLPPGQHERLFEKFQRGQTESNVVGVGLGLAICRAAARLHGGEISAGESPGGGARFEILLPVDTQAAAEPPPEADLQRVWA